MNLTNQQEIKAFLKDYCSIDYCQIDDDLTVNCFHSVYIKKPLHELPIQFGRVEGDFVCSEMTLQSFKGFPHTIEGSLIARQNELSNFDYFPQNIEGDIDLYCNNLTHLYNLPLHHKYSLNLNDNLIVSCVGLPEVIGRSLKIMSNELTSLKGTLKKVKFLECNYNKISTLNEMPEVEDTFDCSSNLLKNLKGISQKIKKLTVKNNQINALIELPSNLEKLDCSYNALTDVNELRLLKNKPLFELNLTSNQIKSIGNLIGQYEDLHLSTNPLEDFNAKNLNVSNLQLTHMENLSVNLEKFNWVHVKLILSHINELKNLHLMNCEKLILYDTFLSDSLLENILECSEKNSQEKMIMLLRSTKIESIIFKTKNLENNPIIKSYLEKKHLNKTLNEKDKKVAIKKI